MSGACDSLKGEAERLAGGHYHCDDSWYCCPKCDSTDHGILTGHGGYPGRTEGECNCGYEKRVTEIEAFALRLIEQRDELLKALKDYKTVLAPWIQRPVKVSFEEWDAAIGRIESTITNEEGKWLVRHKHQKNWTR